jgi:lysine biosynthesis protein LysW
MIFSSCPNCQSDVAVNEPKIGQIIFCPQCAIGLKIVWLLPVELDILNESDYVWDDKEPNYLEENDVNLI